MYRTAINTKIRTKNIIYANDDLFVYCLLFSRREVHYVVKCAYHQITDLCCRKTNAVTAPIANILVILVHLFKGIDKVCKMIETLYGHSKLRAVPIQSGLGHRSDVPISTKLMLMKQSKLCNHRT